VTTLNNPKIVPFDRPPSIFVGCNDDGAFFINKDGSADFLTNDSCHRVFPSPENNWILVIPVEGQAQLYTSDGEYLSEFYSFTAGLDSVIWSPDSLTLYTVTAGALTQITIPDGKRSVIYECTAGQLPCYMIPTNYAWLYW
jgi:hypothetical protein